MQLSINYQEIELSREEIKILKQLLKVKKMPIDEKKYDIEFLDQIGLINHVFETQTMESIQNYKISPLGRAYLRFRKRSDKRFRIATVLSVIAILVSVIAIMV